MYYVYVLKTKTTFYIGSTSDLKSRLSDHLHKKVKSTMNKLPLKLIYYEAYDKKYLAQEREKKLKVFGSSYKGLLKRLDY